ncbi:MAG TPA: aliphatic sulfonate ABC transporter substrate-binding protein [Bacillaceae bacterium]
MKNRILKSIFLFMTAIIITGCSASASDKPKKITLDYAYYSPVSLVLKEKGWAEEAFKEEGVKIEYVLSQGGNKAIEYLNSKSADFGSAAGGAAFIAKAKGSPIESIYVFSKPEWIALVSTDPKIQTVEDLKGKKVAATLGTDMHTFLLRALAEHGLTAKDVEVINLQPGDGATALLSGEVDAWAGLDPHMARLEKDSGAKLIYRNPDFNTYGTLNVRKEFAEKHPEYVKKILEAYEKARQWVLEHPEETTELLAKEAQIHPEVARIQMERNDFSNPQIGEEQKAAIKAAGEVLQKEGIVDSKLDVEKTVDDMITPSYFK